MEFLQAITGTRVVRQLQADLRQDPRKAKALLGLMPLLGFALIPLLFGGYPSRLVKTEIKEAPSTSDSELAVTVNEELRRELAEIMSQERSAPRRLWSGRNGLEAFQTPQGRAQPTELSGGPTTDSATRSAEEEEELARQWQPSSTFLSSSAGNLAIVQGTPYREGDSLESFVLLSVEARAIVLRGTHGDYRIDIPFGEDQRP